MAAGSDEHQDPDPRQTNNNPTNVTIMMMSEHHLQDQTFRGGGNSGSSLNPVLGTFRTFQRL